MTQLISAAHSIAVPPRAIGEPHDSIDNNCVFRG
jgi:hypothetical protein